MDSTTPTTVMTPVIPATEVTAAPEQATMQPAGTPPAQPVSAPLPVHHGSKKRTMLFVIVFLLLLTGGSVAAFNLAQQPSTTAAINAKVIPTTAVPSPAVSPTSVVPTTVEDAELNAIETGNPESDFTEINKDASQL